MSLHVGSIVTVLKEFRLRHKKNRKLFHAIKPGNLCVVTMVLKEVIRVQLNLVHGVFVGTIGKKFIRFWMKSWYPHQRCTGECSKRAGIKEYTSERCTRFNCREDESNYCKSKVTQVPTTGVIHT